MTTTAPPNTVTLTVDGQEVSVPPGTLVVEAARMAGVDVPIFCYHPKLSLAGACRMCVCEIGMPPPPGQPARPPALLTSCTTRVAPGMVVNTMAGGALKARESVIEFLLINHPLDCPVCDAGGECPLQDNSHAWGPKESRFEEDKRLARKGAALSPLVVLDQERCIVCYRCTRFMAEIPGQAELDFYGRGYNSQLRTINDRAMESHFQGNIIELCPCGALTSETYRFKARPHDLDHADSVCAQCPVGCNVIFDTRAGELARVRARQNEAVNEIWLCDKGRFGHHYVSSEERLSTPMVKGEDGALRAASWPEAIGSAAVRLQQIKEQHGGQAIGVIGGRNLTNEDCYALSRFAREVLETPNVDHRVGARSATANPFARFGLNSFNTAYVDAERAGAIFLFGTDIYEEMPVFWLRVRKGVKNGARLLVANPRATEADRIAARRLRYRPGSELAVLRGLLAALVDNPPMEPPAAGVGAQHAAPAPTPAAPAPPPAAEGQPAPEPRPRDLSGLRSVLGGATVDTAAQESGLQADTLRAAAEILAGARGPLIYAGARLMEHPDAEAIAAALVNLATALGNHSAVNLFPAGANDRGAEYAGLVPDEGGLPAGEIIAQAAEGTIKALYLVGENVLATHPDADQARRALSNAELVVVHELFPTDTARQADVVFAAASVAEKDGTMTNAEGRIQRLFRALRTEAADVRPDWRILSDLSGEMGEPLGYAAATELTSDLLADLPAYAGVEAAQITAEGLITREKLEGGESGWAAIGGARAAGAPPREGEGLTLLTYSELLGDETTLRPTPELMEMVPEPYVELNRAHAERLGLSDGQLVRLSTAKGTIQRVARVNGRCPAGVCFSPDNLGYPRINELLDWNVPHTTVQIAAAPAPTAAAAAAGAAGAGD